MGSSRDRAPCHHLHHRRGEAVHSWLLTYFRVVEAIGCVLALGAFTLFIQQFSIFANIVGLFAVITAGVVAMIAKRKDDRGAKQSV